MLEEKTIVVLTDKDEEFVSILTKVGTRKNVAKILVFLANTIKTTQRMIERGLDLRQPEVSIALKYMAEQGWVTSSQIPSERLGRPVREITLAVPLRQILASLEKQTLEEAKSRLELIRKMRSFA